MHPAGAVVISAFAFSPAALAQLSTFTGASTINPVNWCDATNWDPIGIPANGADIAVGPGHTANMAMCDGSTRILGDISAAGTIRFYTPVTFAGDATLNNPIFELSTTPAVVAGQVLISGTNAWWQGAIFSGGGLINTGLLTVERSFISGRTSPRELTNACTFTNDGTVRLLQGFKINGGSTFSNQGTLTCEAGVTIGRDNGAGVIQNNGSITVPAALGLTIASGLVSDGEINSTGTLTLQAETTLRGTARVLSGGTIRALAVFNQPVILGPANLEGEGNVQLSEGAFQIGAVTSSAHGPSGRGLWIASTGDLEISQGSISVSEGGLLTWSLGNFQGGDGQRATPHINISSGARMNVSGAPGLAGGGDALGTFLRVEGVMYQNATARILEGSRLVIPTLGNYVLSHTRMDGDGTVLLEVRGQFNVNPPEDTSTATAFLNAVNTRLLGLTTMTVHRNDLITSASPIELGDDTLVRIGLDAGESARWRAFSDVVITGGDPNIVGQGVFELASGAFLTIGNAALELNLGSYPPAVGEFLQFGTVRADPTLGADARLVNRGNWNWRSGAVAFPQGVRVLNHGILSMDCGSCQLRADLINYNLITIIDTLVMGEAAAELQNLSDVTLLGHVTDLSTALEGRFTNIGRIEKMGLTGSTISTTLDNAGRLTITQGTLTIGGPLEQFLDGTLTGGTWVIRIGATLRTPGKVVGTVGLAANVQLGGSWPEFQPRTNFGIIDVSESNQTFAQDFENFGDMLVTPGRELVMGGTRVYSQRANRTRVEGGLRSSQPVAVTGGTLSGSGTVTSPVLANTGGVVAPGSSPGILTVQGNYSQSDPGELAIEIGGNAPGADYDELVVTGTVSLGGALRVQLINDFLPTTGATFDILSHAGGTGAFSTIDAPGFSVNYLPNSVRLTFIGLPPPCDPDVNCDGSINGFDIEATEQAINGDYSNFCQPTADLNNDGAENGFDIETEEQRVNGAPC
ncbi:hypothetical protein PHYC_00259 [Phycisphaerales bacterium]|nr:hypothetical protein PHYC_00259 [Phycisphaerales bacterium]